MAASIFPLPTPLPIKSDRSRHPFECSNVRHCIANSSNSQFSIPRKSFIHCALGIKRTGDDRKKEREEFMPVHRTAVYLNGIAYLRTLRRSPLPEPSPGRGPTQRSVGLSGWCSTRVKKHTTDTPDQRASKKMPPSNIKSQKSFHIPGRVLAYDRAPSSYQCLRF